MLPFTTTLLLLPTLLTASPITLSARDAPTPSQCTPSTYKISSYTYTYSAASASGSSAIANPSIRIVFAGAEFPDPTMIQDPASKDVVCEARADSLDAFPNEIVCKTAEGVRGGLRFGLRGRVDRAEWQVVHEWGCGGQSWMSSTPLSLAPLSCDTAEDAGQGQVVMKCVKKATDGGAASSFVPQNVRRICAGPTCG